jgi:3-methyladenine DNA glycosylase AlkD
MTLDEVMAELERAGTEQNRKLLGRRGVGPSCFGVSYAVLGQLQKRIKADSALAAKLWSTGNHDARILATMIADPAHCDRAMLESWGRDVDNHVLGDAVASVAGRCAAAQSIADAWCASDDEWLASTGWSTRAAIAAKGGELAEATALGWLETIERELSQSPNRVRHAMNGALIAVGLASDALAAAALAAADRIGPVKVDHGATDCKTPPARAYIEKARARKAKGGG